jgi:hypothetical protein
VQLRFQFLQKQQVAKSIHNNGSTTVAFQETLLEGKRKREGWKNTYKAMKQQKTNNKMLKLNQQMLLQVRSWQHVKFEVLVLNYLPE